MPIAMSTISAGNVNYDFAVLPGAEPTEAERPRQNAELALSIVRSADPGSITCGIDDTASNCILCGDFAAYAPKHFATANGPSHCSADTEPLGFNTLQDDAQIANPWSCNMASRDQGLPFCEPLHTVRKGVKQKNKMEGFSLPDSLARSFDSSEMDKIAKAIVRVNKYGSPAEMISLQKPGASSQSCAFKNSIPRVLPSVGAFTVQCANCFKWRLIPSKEEYEQIRQDILEKPFFCTSWRPGASCADPPELDEDAKLLWAIDKPNIPLTPNGWKRLLVIRGEGSSKFGDIYYVSPSGKKLRSMPEIERYLAEHPEFANEGVSLSQFSFSTPRALDENYCRKRTSGSSALTRGTTDIPSNDLRVRP